VDFSVIVHAGSETWVNFVSGVQLYCYRNMGTQNQWKTCRMQQSKFR